MDFYRSPGELTDLSSLEPQLRDLPSEVDELVRVLQGLLVHIHWAGAYGIAKEEIRADEVQLRAAAATLRRALELDPAPLGEPRPASKRVFANCRHFSTLLAALLRHQGTPARARCGFGLYFEPGKRVDHWICEVWCPERGDWIGVDAQLDALQQSIVKPSFDPLDVPRESFQVGGVAWQACRRGEVDPSRYGILDMWGQWFVEGNLVRDLASLHKLELLPWDDWGIMGVAQDRHTPADFRLLDRVAAVTALASDVRALQELGAHESLRVPRIIQSWREDGLVKIDLSNER